MAAPFAAKWLLLHTFLVFTLLLVTFRLVLYVCITLRANPFSHFCDSPTGYNQAVSEHVLGVLAGGDCPPEMLKKWAASADILLAADAGVDRLLAAGFEPDVAVGDFDSISEAARSMGFEMVVEQNETYTDCDKLLLFAHINGWDEISLICVEGDRLDHLLATLHSCIATPQKVRIIFRTGLGTVLKPGNHALDVTPGHTVSILPLLPIPSIDVAGVQWPLQRERLILGETVSISNVATSDVVQISFGDGAALFTQQMPADATPQW